MKTATTAFETLEQNETLSPVEIFHIWEEGDSGEHWYYTSADESVTYDGNTYTPAAIKRSSMSFDSELEVTKVGVTVGALDDTFISYMTQNPTTQMWVAIYRLHRSDESDASVVFIGQVNSVSFQGAQAEAECYGFEHFLKMKVPRYLYQSCCNNAVFDDRCGLAKEDYATTAEITLSGSGMYLSANAFGTKDDDWFTYGWVVYGDQRRMVTAHTGTMLTLQYPFQDIEDGDEVTAYAGCDLDIETCRDKFGNVAHFFGTPYIPEVNSTTEAS